MAPSIHNSEGPVAVSATPDLNGGSPSADQIDHGVTENPYVYTYTYGSFKAFFYS
jgi:hypothetical protein